MWETITSSGLNVGTMSRSTDGVHQQVMDYFSLVSSPTITVTFPGLYWKHAKQWLPALLPHIFRGEYWVHFFFWTQLYPSTELIGPIKKCHHPWWKVKVLTSEKKYSGYLQNSVWVWKRAGRTFPTLKHIRQYYSSASHSKTTKYLVFSYIT